MEPKKKSPLEKPPPKNTPEESVTTNVAKVTTNVAKVTTNEDSPERPEHESKSRKNRYTPRNYEMTEARSRALEKARMTRARNARDRHEAVKAQVELREMEKEFREFRKSDYYRSGKWKTTSEEKKTPDPVIEHEDECDVIFV
jgi:hypothetical protein